MSWWESFDERLELGVVVLVAIVVVGDDHRLDPIEHVVALNDPFVDWIVGFE